MLSEQCNAAEYSNSSFEPNYSSELALPAMGDQVSIYWPFDSVYYNGRAKSIKEDGNKYCIMYEDRDAKIADLTNEVQKRSQTSTTCPPKVVSEKSDVLRAMSKYF